MSWTDAIGGSFSGARDVAASLAARLPPPSMRRSTRVYTASPAVPLDSVNTPVHMIYQNLRRVHHQPIKQSWSAPHAADVIICKHRCHCFARDKGLVQ